MAMDTLSSGGLEISTCFIFCSVLGCGPTNNKARGASRETSKGPNRDRGR